MPDHGEGREKPRCVATVICNQIIEDIRTRSKTLVGLFNHVFVGQLPAGIITAVLGAFAEGRGVWHLRLRIRDPQHRVIFQAETDANFVDPLAVCDVSFHVVNLLLTSEGVYDVDFLLDNEPVGHRSFTVKSV